MEDYYDLEQVEPEDDGQQNLEEEAMALLKSWNRDILLDEVGQEKDGMNADEVDLLTFYDGETSFEDLQKDMTRIENMDIWIKVLKENKAGARIHADSNVKYDHAGFLEYDRNSFENSIVDGKPALKNLMDGPIICGLIAGFMQLREGECATILIHPRYAYGARGAFPLVPPDAWLYYSVKIYKVWQISELDELERDEREKRWTCDFSVKLGLIDEHMLIAKNYLKDNLPKEAAPRYNAAIKMIDNALEDGLTVLSVVRPYLIKLLTNSAVVYNRLKMYRTAGRCAKRSLFLEPENDKAFYHLIKSRIELGEYQEAMKWIGKAHRYCGDKPCFNNLKLQLDFKQRDEVTKCTEMMKRMASLYV